MNGYNLYTSLCMTHPGLELLGTLAPGTLDTDWCWLALGVFGPLNTYYDTARGSLRLSFYFTGEELL